MTQHKDHFVKRDRVSGLCPRCAATCLYVLQTYAPSGGAGHRTSLRGGGPLTTVVLGRNLWETAWLNTLPQRALWHDRCAVFPWMRSTRTSNEKLGGGPTAPQDVHFLQAYWGMPRRIRLGSPDTEGTCGVCAAVSAPLIVDYRTRPYGTNYEGGWEHPLTPFVLRDSVPMPVHPQPGGIRYGFWLGMIVADSEGLRQPAKVIRENARRLESGAVLNTNGLQVLAFGYDMDNMKARCWYEGELPLSAVPEPYAADFKNAGERLVSAADKAANMLGKCIKDAAAGGAFRERFWGESESLFYDALNQVRERILAGGSPADTLWSWLAILQGQALAIFDDILQVDQIVNVHDAARIVQARKILRTSLARNKKNAGLLGLALPTSGEGNGR